MKLRTIALIGILLISSKVDAQVQINYGIPETSLSTASTGVVTGTVYNLPTTYAAIVTWQVVADGSALSVNLEGSADNVTYATIDTQTTATGGVKNYGFTAIKYIRCSQVSRTGGTISTCTLTVSRGLITSTFPGTISAGVFLSNDGSAGAPSHSFLGDPTTGWYRQSNGILTASVLGANRVGMGSSTIGLQVISTFPIGWSPDSSVGQSTSDTALTRGGAAGKVTLTGTTPMLQFGGTTSSFPSLKNAGGQLQVRNADDSGFAPFEGGTVQAAVALFIGSNLTASATNPTISSGFGTSPSIVTPNGTASFIINVGTGAVATSGVIGLPTASNGWSCFATDITATSTHTALETEMTASTTTTVTIESQNRATGAATAWAASSLIRLSCFAY